MNGMGAGFVEGGELAAMNQAQKIVLIGVMIILKALHVIFVHDSTHTHSPARSKADGEESAASQGSGESHDYGYDTVMAVILAEGMKLLVSAVLFARAYMEEQGHGHDLQPVVHGARRDWEGMTRQRALGYALPALIYMIEDNLRFVVLKKLHTPVTWMIFGHLEIPFVAFMSTTLLGRVFTTTQWVSIVLLLNGVMSSQLAVCESRMHQPCSHMSDYPVVGIAMVSMCALFAASAGIASEFIYKRDSSVSIWLQNCLLYSFAIGSNLLVLLAKSMSSISSTSGEVGDTGLFHGFDSLMPWCVVLTMGGMGLCVSAVIKHMSNLAKVYTSALGIFVTAALSAVFEDFELSLPFVLAASEVVCALYLYVIEKDKVPEHPNAPSKPLPSPKGKHSTLGLVAIETQPLTASAHTQ